MASADNDQAKLAIFGFDFVVDHTERVWLIEANHGPCFPMADDHPLQQTLYDKFWHHFIDLFVKPIASNNVHTIAPSLDFISLASPRGRDMPIFFMFDSDCRQFATGSARAF